MSCGIKSMSWLFTIVDIWANSYYIAEISGKFINIIFEAYLNVNENENKQNNSMQTGIKFDAFT